MKMTQTTIDSMSDDDFIKSYVERKTDWITLSETREVIKYSYSKFYNVLFKYTVVLNKNTWFNKNVGVFNKEIVDNINFANKDDAMLYMNIVLRPSKEFTDSYKIYSSRYKIYVNFDKCDINLKFNKKSFIEAACKGYGGTTKTYFGVYGTGLYDDLSLYGSIQKMTYGAIVKSKTDYTVISSLSINDLISDKDNTIAKLKENLEEYKGEMNEVIASEIVRTRQYLDFLIKLSK